MSAEELKDFERKLQEGFEQAQYDMLLDKALKNQNVVRCNEKGGWQKCIMKNWVRKPKSRSLRTSRGSVRGQKSTA